MNTLAKPALPDQCKVIDKRVRNRYGTVNAVTYTVINGIIPSVDSTQVERLAAQAPRGALFTLPPDVTLRRTIIIAVLLVLVTSPLVVTYWRTSRCDRKQANTQPDQQT